MTEAEVREKYRIITQSLIQKEKTITTMESCTGGLLASLLTDTEGASAVLKGAYVTYSNEGKVRNGVPGEIIERYGVYSKETAKAMANACRESYDADYAVGVTGTMGNKDPANGDSVPGRVFFAIADRENIEVLEVLIEPEKTRYEYKIRVAGLIADALLIHIEA